MKVILSGRKSATISAIACLFSLLVLNAAQGQTALQCRGDTQHDIDVCTNNAFLRADAELKRLLISEQEGLGTSESHVETRRKILNAQHAWLVYRDAHCEGFVSIMSSGSGFSQHSATCKDILTRQRIENLKNPYE